MVHRLSGQRFRAGILISGRGSNMAALIAATSDPAYPAEIACVIANRADAAGLDQARAAGIPAELVPHRDHATRAGFEAALDARLRAHAIDAVLLAGFMRVLTPGFVARWEGRLLNIHPSLLPAFPGLDTHSRALAAGCKVHGCTVHFVVPDVDAGPIVAQACVPVLDDDTADTLAARVLAEEHRLYPQALAALAEGRLRVSGQRVRIA